MTEPTPLPGPTEPIIASWMVRINLRGSEDDKDKVPTNSQLETELVDAMSDVIDERGFSDEATVTVEAERLDK